MQKYSLHINFVHKVCRIIDYGNLFCPLSGKEKEIVSFGLCVSDDWVFVNNVFLGTNGVLVNPPFLRQNVPFIIYPSWYVCVCVSDQICDEFPSIKKSGSTFDCFEQIFTVPLIEVSFWLFLNRAMQASGKFPEIAPKFIKLKQASVCFRQIFFGTWNNRAKWINFYKQ